MLSDHLEGWDRKGGREGDARGKRYEDICIGIADSLCYKAETNTPLSSNYTPIKVFKKKKRNKIELFVVRWMDLVCVIQSEVGQKEKNQIQYAAYICNL